MLRVGVIIVVLSQAYWASDPLPSPAIKPAIVIPVRTSPAPRPVNPLPHPVKPALKPATQPGNESRNPFMPDKPSEKRDMWDTEVV